MAKIREIKPGGCRVTPLSVPDLGDDPATWLSDQARQRGLTTLLAHADDGVIWGQVEDGRLITSHDAFADVSPPLRTLTLQQARLFGAQVELLLWRGEIGWLARLVEDAPGSGEHCDEGHVLWGNQRHDGCKGFTLVHEGRQGLFHAPPVGVLEDAFAGGRRPLRLRVRHYLGADPDTGLVRVAISRLVKVEAHVPEVQR